MPHRSAAYRHENRSSRFLSDRAARRSVLRVSPPSSRRSARIEPNKLTGWKSITRTTIPRRTCHAEAPPAQHQARCRSTSLAAPPKRRETPGRNRDAGEISMKPSLPQPQAEAHTMRPPTLREDRGLRAEQAPSPTEIGEEKLLRLGDAPIQRRSTESPRHRSARVPDTEVSETHAITATTGLPPKRPPCHCPPKRKPRTPAVRIAEATRSALVAESVCRRSDALKSAERAGRRSDRCAATFPLDSRSHRSSMKRAKFDDEAPTNPKAGQLPHPLQAETLCSRGEPACLT